MSDSKLLRQAATEISQYLSLIGHDVVDISNYSSWQQRLMAAQNNLGVTTLGLCMSTRQRLQNIYHRTNHLPTEVLEEILEWVLGSVNVLGRVRMAFGLRLVCQRWNQIIITRPRFFRAVFVNAWSSNIPIHQFLNNSLDVAWYVGTDKAQLPATASVDRIFTSTPSASIRSLHLIFEGQFQGHHVRMERTLSRVFCQPSFRGIEHLEIVDMVEELVPLPSLHLLPKLRTLEVIRSQVPTITLGETTSVRHIYFEALVAPTLIGTEAFYHPWRFLNGCRRLQSLRWANMGTLDGMFSVDPGVPGDWSFSLDRLDMEIRSRTSCTAGLMLLSHTGLWVRELNISLGGRAVCDSEVLYRLASGNVEKLRFYVEDSVAGQGVEWGSLFEDGALKGRFPLLQELIIVQEGGFHWVSELHGWMVRLGHTITAKANFLHHTAEQYEYRQRSGGYPLMLELGKIPGNIKSVDGDVLVRDSSPIQRLGQKVVRSSFGEVDISEMMREQEESLNHSSDHSEVYLRLPWARKTKAQRVDKTNFIGALQGNCTMYFKMDLSPLLQVFIIGLLQIVIVVLLGSLSGVKISTSLTEINPSRISTEDMMRQAVTLAPDCLWSNESEADYMTGMDEQTRWGAYRSELIMCHKSVLVYNCGKTARPYIVSYCERAKLNKLGHLCACRKGPKTYWTGHWCKQKCSYIAGIRGSPSHCYYPGRLLGSPTGLPFFWSDSS
ncbi:hypothetical protein BS47DRAFT_1368010 [Hydnum rufescens UP504]|uniref:F-box domain-containing protein n=1 Tax=Hydnum rufescens UP504 TaxID=1448309 RepID=A0A9P6DPC6_9AGAM|nr:hypothetical protein BS47DRAFT_1368010 [Hydnum rufescens UP504]